MSNITRGITWVGFIQRLVFALLLVLLTYNPSGYSFIDWVAQDGDGPLVYKAVSGIVLLIGWVIYLRATKNSLGPIGMVLAALLFSCLVWLLIEWGIFDPNNLTTLTWIVELVLAGILAIGMSWSHVRRRLTGQVDTDEIDS